MNPENLPIWAIRFLPPCSMMLGLLQAKEEVERAIMLRSIAARALWLTKGAALFGGADSW